ncbi:MAG: nucleotidyltransferase domain-containing protein [Solirubrobacteraceae bacterium]
MSVPLPAPVAKLAADLAELPGAVAVVLAARVRPRRTAPTATGTSGSTTVVDNARWTRRTSAGSHGGYVSGLGEWGPIVHGGAWLTVEGIAVDVLFRDLDVVERWLDDAQRGRFDVLMQNGYVVGAPTYLPVGELSICQPIVGQIPRPSFPQPLTASAPERWQGRASVALMFARAHAALGDCVCCLGMLVHAVLCAAHGRLAQRGEWVLNEKRLVQRAGLDDVQPLLARPGSTTADLLASATAVSAALQIQPLNAR